MKKLLILFLLLVPLVLAWCSDAETVSYNISREADYFKIVRRVIFYNWITNDYMLSIEWRCSINYDELDNQLEVTCKLWEDEYKKHYLWLSDNVTYFVEQMESEDVSADHYKVIFKPSIIIPDISIR